MKHRVATIFYNDTKDETTVKFADDYDSYDSLLRADIMSDAVFLVDKAYSEAWKIFSRDIRRNISKKKPKLIVNNEKTGI